MPADLQLPENSNETAVRPWLAERPAMGNWVSSKMDAASIARGLAVHRVNALVAAMFGGIVAWGLALAWPGSVLSQLLGFGIGLLYANAFEYFYHRFVLHGECTSFWRRHALHHQTWGTVLEPEHVNFGGSPLCVVVVLAFNIAPFVVAEPLFHIGTAAGVMVAFVLYLILIATEEIHWQIHLGQWLPPGLKWTRVYHLVHHARPDSRFNIFIPLFDRLCGTPGGSFKAGGVRGAV